MAIQRIPAGTAYPRSRLGPSVIPVSTKAPLFGEGIISPYSAPTVQDPLGTGGANTPVPPPPTPDPVQDRVVESGHRFPQTANLAISTIVDTNFTREQFLQLAMAGYVGVTNFAVTRIRPTAGMPSPLLSFVVPNTNFFADSFQIFGMNQTLLMLCQFTVTLNGNIEYGPAFLPEGRADLNIFAKTTDSIAVNLIVPSNTDLVSTCRVLLNGYRDI